MSFYGYDPSKYVKDMSWLRQLGADVVNVAQKIPAFISLNRQVKENKALKNQLYTTSEVMIDSLKDEDLELLRNNLKLSSEGKENVKNELKQLIPKWTTVAGRDNEMTNEEYMGPIAKFHGSILQGLFGHITDPNEKIKKIAQYKANADRYANQAGTRIPGLGEAIKQTAPVQELTQQARGIEQQQITGQIGAEQRAEERKAVAGEQRQEGQRAGSQIQDIVQRANQADPLSVFDVKENPQGEPYTDQERKEAYNFILQQNRQKNAEEARKMRAMHNKPPKELNPIQKENLLLAIDTHIKNAENELEKAKQNKDKGLVRESRENLIELKKSREAVKSAIEVTGRGEDLTAGGFQRELQKGRETVGAEEQSAIEQLQQIPDPGVNPFEKTPGEVEHEEIKKVYGEAPVYVNGKMDVQATIDKIFDKTGKVVTPRELLRTAQVVGEKSRVFTQQNQQVQQPVQQQPGDERYKDLFDNQ